MVLIIKKVLCLIGEALEEEDDEPKDPESATQELAMFDCAMAWMEEGGSPTLEENDSQSSLTQVFSLNPLLFIMLAVSPICLLPMDYPGYSIFCRDSISCNKPVTCDGRQSTSKPKACKRLSSQWPGQRLRISMMS